MSAMTIAKTRDNLSAIIGGLERGEITEHLIKNRARLVARIVPIDGETAPTRRIGVAAKDPAFRIDDELFDDLDTEIAHMFGI